MAEQKAKTFTVYSEIPAGSPIKYETDEETGQIFVDRFMFTSFVYPTGYGYIKDTKAEDGDAVDVLLLSLHPVMPGATIECHAVGLMEMEDEGGIDTKILVVPTAKIDPVYGTYEDIEDVPEAQLARIKHFFERYKDLEPEKWVKIKEFKNAQAAYEQIDKASSL